MPYYDAAKLVTITKTNMIDKMPCGCGTLWTTAVRIRHHVTRRPAKLSQQPQNLTILYVKYQSILNAPPYLQVPSGAPENALAESESTFLSSRGPGSIWQYLKALVRSTGVSWRFACSFRTNLHFVDVYYTSAGIYWIRSSNFRSSCQLGRLYRPFQRRESRLNSGYYIPQFKNMWWWFQKSTKIIMVGLIVQMGSSG